MQIHPEDQWALLNAWWIKTFLYALFAAFGGIMGHLMRTIDRREKINWKRAMVEGGAAGFVGLLVFMTCQALQLSEQWTGVIVGVSGWLGANATIRILEAVIFNRLGITKHDIPNKDE